MEEIHQFGQRLFGFVLPGHIGKGLAGLGLHINFGIALAKGHGAGAAHFFGDGTEHQRAQQGHDGKGEHHVQQHGQQGGQAAFRHSAEADFGIQQALGQLRVTYVDRGVYLGTGALRIFQFDGDLIALQLHYVDLSLVQQVDEIAVIDLPGAGGEQHIDEDDNEQKPQIIDQQRTLEPLWVFSVVGGSWVH